MQAKAPVGQRGDQEREENVSARLEQSTSHSLLAPLC